MDNETTIDNFVKALNGEVHECGVIKTSEIIFLKEVREICKGNECGNYNKYWGCPPAVGSFDEMVKKTLSYDNAFVFTTISTLTDSFDFDGIIEAQEKHHILTQRIRKQFYKNNLIYGAEGCYLCKKCSFPDPCKFPELMNIPVEAAGINVIELSKSAFVNYNNGLNTVTYFSMILFNNE